MLLLDTHAWVWSVEGLERRIGRGTRRLLSRAASGNLVRVSSLSIFEVTALHTAGRLQFSRPLEQWIQESLSLAGIRVTELSAAAAIDAGHISRSALADPIDRLLVATARQLDATLVTADQRMLGYAARTGHVRVRDASR